MGNNLALFGITRIDHKKTHNWWVRLKYIGGKPQIQKSFPDLKLGGISQSFTAAVSYRDEQMFLHNLPLLSRKLSWKNRTRKERRTLQKKHGRKVVTVGMGREGAKKAYDLGMSRSTCLKINTGKQNQVEVNRGGWHTPEYEDFGFKHDVSYEQCEEIKGLVNYHAGGFSEAEKSEMVSDIMIKLSLGMIKREKPIEGTIKKWVSLRKRRKSCPHRREHPLDINGDMIKLHEDK